MDVPRCSWWETSIHRQVEPLEWSNPRSALEDTERVMGWDVVGSGFKVVLSPDVPKLSLRRFPASGRADGWCRHEGTASGLRGGTSGPKVLTTLQEALDLEQEDLQLSWDCLRAYGNMSSASVLFILEDTINNPPPPGSVGVIASDQASVPNSIS